MAVGARAYIHVLVAEEYDIVADTHDVVTSIQHHTLFVFTSVSKFKRTFFEAYAPSAKRFIGQRIILCVPIA